MPVRRREHFVFLEKPAFFPLGVADGRGGGLETVGGKEGGNILSEYMADEKLSITTVIILENDGPVFTVLPSCRASHRLPYASA